MTREEVLLLRDAELISFYDDCIDVFEEYKLRERKLESLRSSYRDKKTLRFVKTLGWLLPLAITFLFIALYFRTYTPRTISWVEQVLSSPIPTDEEYEADMELLRDRSVIAGSILTGITVFWLIVGLKSRKKAIAEQVEAEARYQEYRKELRADINAPIGKLADAFLVFDTIDPRLPYELRKLVFDCIASTHREAQLALRHEIERSEDKQWRQEMIAVIRESYKKDTLDKLEQVANIGSGLFK